MQPNKKPFNKQKQDPSKSLHSMTREELGKLFPITLSKPSENWVKLFQEEKQVILDAFAQSEIISIEHIGSTAIPGIKAKPTIDILLQVKEKTDNQRIIDVFNRLGYQINNHPENPPPHMTFVKGYTINGYEGQAFHVHIRYQGDWDEIRFRDYLIRHKETAKAYESLKTELAKKYRYDREAYTLAKTVFIEKINHLTQKQTDKPK